MSTDKQKGLWNREQQYGLRLDEEFALGEEFVVVSTGPAPELVTKDGEAIRRVELSVRRLSNTAGGVGPVYAVRTAASAIVEMMGDAIPSDFPLVAKLAKVKTRHENDALVLRLVRPFAG